MPLREPSWWYQPEPALAARLLTPVAWVYGAVASRRMRRAPSVVSPLPVICIGNFTAGGTGKTPLAMLLADRLQRRGFAPVFLTRGYGSAVVGPTLADPARHRAGDVGDEALLLARIAPVVVAPDRAAGAQAIADLKVKADLIIMDDGLQNPSLAKDLRIAVVDGARGFGNGCVSPAGPLRAPLSRQLASVDVIVVNGRRDDGAAVARRIADGYSGPLLSAHQIPCRDAAWLRGAVVVAFAGIGNPERFYALLQHLGAQIAAKRSFADHHAFTDAEAAQLIADAKRLGATLVTTEKDLARLSGSSGVRAELAQVATQLAIATVFDDDGEERLLSLVFEAIERRQRSAQSAG